MFNGSISVGDIHDGQLTCGSVGCFSRDTSGGVDQRNGEKESGTKDQLECGSKHVWFPLVI